MRGTVTLALLAVFSTENIAAQHAPPPIGTRIRATPSESRTRHIGTLIAQLGDTLVIERPERDTVRLPLAGLDRLEVSNGQRSNFWRGANYGLLIGAAGGAIAGAAAIDSEWAAVGALVGAAAGGGLGLLVGGAIGSNSSRELWQPAPGWELSFSVRLSIRFG